jgi:hypothetical protein
MTGFKGSRENCCLAKDQFHELHSLALLFRQSIASDETTDSSRYT